MVTNSLGEEKFHAANSKAQACTQGAFAFCPFKFWDGVCVCVCGGGGGKRTI
jgi:hypothetical protein